MGKVGRGVVGFVMNPLGTVVGAVFGKKAGAIVSGIAQVALGVATGNPAFIAMGLGNLSAGLAKTPKVSPATSARLNMSVNPLAYRPMVLGSTAMANELRDQEYTGANKEFAHRFVVVAAHRVEAIREVWFDDKLAWANGAVQGEFVNFLQVTPVLEGSAANAINISSRMGSSRRFTGCAYLHFRYRLTGTEGKKKIESPFASSIPTRVTIIGDGIPTYDPRQDSSVGGSGSHRADDQNTWTWGSHARNPACQLLTYMLGWRINGKLSVGRGIPAGRLNLSSFMTGANLCDEPVTMAAGGTEPRYRSDGVVTEGDPLDTVLGSLLASMNAHLDDVDGQLRLQVLFNDLGTPQTPGLTTDDVLGDYTWSPFASLDSMVNIVRGHYVAATSAALYQMVEYPSINLPTPDGIDRVETVDYGMVQSPSQAQRLSKQRAQRAQYPGLFTAEFQTTAWRYQKGDVVPFTFEPLGFVNKLFRIIAIEVREDGVVPLTLREEHPSIYAWDRDDSAVVTPAAAAHLDWSEGPIGRFLETIEEGAEVTTGKSLTLLIDRTSTNITHGTENLGTFLDAIAGTQSNHSQLISDAAAAQALLTAAQVTLRQDVDDIELDVSALVQAQSQMDAAYKQADATLTAGQQTLSQGQATLSQGLTDLWSILGNNDQSGIRARVITLETQGTGPDEATATRITALESSVNHATDGLSATRARVGTLESTVAGNDTAISTRVTSVESEITNARGGFGNLSARFSNVVQTITDGLAGKASVTSVTDLSAEVTNARGGFGTLSARFTNVVQTITDGLAGKASTTDVTNLSSEVTNARGGTASLSARFTQVNQTIVDAVAGKADASQVTSLQSEITNARGGTANLSARFTQVNQAIVDATAGKAEASTVTSLQSEISDARGGYGTLSAKFGTFSGTVADQLAGKASSSTVTSLESRVTAAEGVGSGNATELTNARGGYASLSAKIGTFSGTVADALSGKASSTVVTALESEVVSARQGYGSLNAKLGTFTGTLADALQGKASVMSVSSLESRTTNLEGSRVTTATFNAYQTTVSDALAGKASASSVTNLESRATNLENSRVTTSTFSSYQTTVSDALAGKASASDLSTLTSRVTNVEGSRVLNSTFSSYQTTVSDALAGKASAQSVTDLSASVNGFDGRITTAQSVASDAQGKINASHTLLLDAGGRVAGYRIQSSNSNVSTFDVLTNVFRVTDGSTTIAPFTISGGQVLINGTLSVFSATSGARVTLTSNLIEVFDTNAVRRVRLGVW